MNAAARPEVPFRWHHWAMSALALVALPAVGLLGFVQAHPHAFEAAPAPKTLLVAVDLLDGSARALKSLRDEEQCGRWARDAADNAVFRSAIGGKDTERLECRVPR